MPKNKHLNNIEFVTQIMKYSSYGALSQAFIIEAVRRYSEDVIEHEHEVRESMMNHIINPEAWLGVAREIDKKIKER